MWSTHRSAPTILVPAGLSDDGLNLKTSTLIRRCKDNTPQTCAQAKVEHLLYNIPAAAESLLQHLLDGGDCILDFMLFK